MDPSTEALAGLPRHLGPGETGAEPMSPQLLQDPVAYFVSGYRKHGPIFRTRFRGRDWVTIAGLEANDFFWQNPADWSYRQAGPGFTHEFGPTYVTQLDGAAHARKRRLLKPGFSAEAVGQSVPVMAQAAAEFLRAGWAEAADADDWIPALLLTMNARSLLQIELTAEQVAQASAYEGQLIWGVAVCAQPEEFFGRPEYLELKRRVYAPIDAELEARLAGKRRADNLQALLDQNSGALEPLSPVELRHDAYMLLVAGIHNTAKLITRCLERLSQAPEWVAALREELAAVTPASFARGLGAFPKLKATIFESERLHPGSAFLRRSAARDLEFAGRRLPAGTPVLQAHVLPHFLPELYPEPLVFRPQRWLEGEPPRKALVDFGGGAHICLGMNLSRIQTPLVLAELLLRYEWTPEYPPAFGLKTDPGLEFKRSRLPLKLRPLP